MQYYKFNIQEFAQWLSINIPLMHKITETKFNLPATTASQKKQIRDASRTSLHDRHMSIDFIEYDKAKRVLDYGCGDPFYNIKQ